jgi:molybdate transport system permease protein
MVVSAVMLTAQLAATTTVVLLLLATPIAWWLARSTSGWRHLVEAVVALPIALPPTVLGFYLLVLLGPDGPLGRWMLDAGWQPWVFRFEGLLVGSVLYSLPFAVQPIQASFMQMDRRLLEVSATLGLGPLARWRKVVLPLTRRGFLTAAVLAFAHTVGEFGVVLMVGGNIPGETQVLSTLLYDRVEALDYEAANRMASGLLLFALLVLWGVYRMQSTTREDAHAGD